MIPIEVLDSKEKEIREKFFNTREEAAALENEIKQRQAVHSSKIDELTRLQGALAVIKDLRKTIEVKEKKETQ